MSIIGQILEQGARRHMVVIIDDLCSRIRQDRREVIAREAFAVARKLESEHAEMLALLHRTLDEAAMADIDDVLVQDIENALARIDAKEDRDAE